MSSINEAIVYFETYGLWFLFIIVYLEYLNLLQEKNYDSKQISEFEEIIKNKNSQ